MKRKYDVLLVALLAIFACAPLSYPGFFFGQSGLAALYNLADLRESLSLSWRPGLGLGPGFGGGTLFPYYLGALFALLGLSSIAALKLLYGLGFLLSATGTYAFVTNLLSQREEPWPAGGRLKGGEDNARRAAILSAVIYTYLPFHLAATYVRGDLGESLAYGLAPWAGLCLYRLKRQVSAVSKTGSGTLTLALSLDGKGEGTGPAAGLGWLIAGAVAATALILSSPGSGLLALLVLALGSLISASRVPLRGHLVKGALVVAVPLVLGTAIAWPLASTSGSSGPASVAAGDLKTIDLSQLFSPAMGFNAPGSPGSLPVQVGLVAAALTLLSLVPAAGSRKEESIGRGGEKAVTYYQAAVLLLLALLLPPLAPAWAVLGQLVGEPIQLLLALGLPLSVVAGSVLMRKGLRDPLASASLVLLAVLGSYGYLSPQFADVDEPAHVVGAKVGEDIVLLDYHLISAESNGEVTEMERGGEVRLRLVWQALRPSAEDLTVFSHLLDSSQNLRGQHDGQPSAGLRPTSKWLAGDVIVDDHLLKLDPDAPAGDYLVQIGMYVPRTGERLPIATRGLVDTRLVLQELKVKG